MRTLLEQISIAEIVQGFVYNEAEGKGLYGLNGRPPKWVKHRNGHDQRHHRCGSDAGETPKIELPHGNVGACRPSEDETGKHKEKAHPIIAYVKQ
ncbi:MAG: hypothetical protein Q4A71_07725 [Actinomycetaceae bacterium]|nr:hypothetical protein [Actinomycetaceae bacterium]